MNKRFILLLHLFFLIFNLANLAASLNFCNRNAYIYPYTYNSGIKISNKNSVKGYKKQDIVKAEQAEALFINNNQTFQSNSIFVPKETFDLVSSFYIPDNQILEFYSNAVIDGNGQDLILGKNSQLLIDGGVTVTFKNMTIKNTLNTTSCPPIRCMDWYSKVCFDNVKFEFGDDWIFRNGQFFVHNDVEFTGTSKFSYRSVCSSFVTSHANLIFDPRTTFEYYPSTANNKLIQMQDKTSTIIFDGSTLQATHTGIRLTKGSVYFDNRTTLSSSGITLASNLLTATQTSHSNSTYAISWSPDGKYLSVGNYGVSEIYYFNGVSLSLVTTTTDSSRYTKSIAWSPNGKYVALGNFDQVSQIYSFDGSALTLTTSTKYIRETYGITWSPDGKYLALGNSGCVSEVYAFDGSSLILTASTLVASRATRAIAWRPDGEYLVLGNMSVVSDIYRFDGKSLSLVVSTTKVPITTRTVAWSPDGKYLSLGSTGGSFGNRNEIYFFNDTSLSWITDVANDAGIRSMLWSPCGKFLAFGNYGQASTIYSFNGGFLSYIASTYFSRNTLKISWSPDGKYLSLGNFSQISDVYTIIYQYDNSVQGYSNGIIFGNSQLGTSCDLDVYLLGGSNLNVFGKIEYDSVN